VSSVSDQLTHAETARGGDYGCRNCSMDNANCFRNSVRRAVNRSSSAVSNFRFATSCGFASNKVFDGSEYFL
jgi:hypothetical protein